ncbi:MAG: hypothetical protein Q3983_06465 [Capnocytophaga sp.]|nr:hypothetical protein [Capnocytophaga sp.]
MGKAIRNYLIILGLLVVFMAMTVFSSEGGVNWEKTYDVKDTNPYGFYIFNQEIDHFFDKKVKKIAITPYEFFKIEKPTKNSNYILTDEIDKTSLKNILSDVENGSNAFFISSYISYLDTLGVSVETDYFYFYKKELELTTKSFTKKIEFPEESGGTQAGYFNSLNENNSRALGYIYDEGIKKINFVEITHGKGKIFIHLGPIVFSNYFLKDFPEIRKYTSTVISYLPKDKQTIWFDKNFNENIISGDLGFIMSKPALKTAWQLMLLGLFLYLIFKGKREQRIIPIIKAPENTTIEFAQSISTLYYQEGEPTDLVKKKITYFLDHIRNNYYIDTQEINEKFIEKLHNKSGKDKDLITKIVQFIIHFEKTQQADDKALTNLDKWIETFWN